MERYSRQLTQRISDRKIDEKKEEGERTGNTVVPPVTSVLLLLFPAEALSEPSGI